VLKGAKPREASLNGIWKKWQIRIEAAQTVDTSESEPKATRGNFAAVNRGGEGTAEEDLKTPGGNPRGWRGSLRTSSQATKLFRKNSVGPATLREVHQS